MGFIENDDGWSHPKWPGHTFYSDYLGTCVWVCCDIDHEHIEADIRKKVIEKIYRYKHKEIECLKLFGYEEDTCDNGLFVMRYDRFVYGETVSVTFIKYPEIWIPECYNNSFEVVDHDDNIINHIPPILLKIQKYKDKLDTAKSNYNKRLEFYRSLKK